MNKLYELTAHKLHTLLINKQIKVIEIVDSIIKRIEEVDKKINAYITKTFDLAQQEAKRLDQEISKNKNKKFSYITGIPIAVKDNISTAGILTTCGSKILSCYVPNYDATVIEKIKANDGIIIGKTNMDEFAMGSSTENSYFGPTRLPIDTNYVSGGSSGGAAACICANAAILSLGSDTGGSIRQPAAFCGVVGLKPTYGRISRYGLIAFASSLDQIGTLTKDVLDAAMLFTIIGGYDPKDATSINYPMKDYFELLKRTEQTLDGLKGIVIGLPKEYFTEQIDQQVKKCVEEAAKKMNKLGAELEEISLRYTAYALATYYIIATAEASSNLGRYDGIRYGYSIDNSDLTVEEAYKKVRMEGFGEEVKRRIMLGSYVLSKGYYDAYYKRAQKLRHKIAEDFKEAFKKCHLILTPTSPTVAFKIGEKIDDPLKMYLSDILTVGVNLAGLPAISIPAGKINNLPVGLQLIGNTLEEELILKVGYIFEKYGQSM